MGRKFIYSTNINIYHIECTYHQEGNFKQVSEEENQIAFMLDKIIPTCWNLVLHSLCPTYWYLTANHPPTAVSWEDSPAMRKNASYQKTLHFWCDVSHKQCAGENLHICQRVLSLIVIMKKIHHMNWVYRNTSIHSPGIYCQQSYTVTETFLGLVDFVPSILDKHIFETK